MRAAILAALLALPALAQQQQWTPPLIRRVPPAPARKPIDLPALPECSCPEGGVTCGADGHVICDHGSIYGGHGGGAWYYGDVRDHDVGVIMQAGGDPTYTPEPATGPDYEEGMR